jgi:hypothetical protein
MREICRASSGETTPEKSMEPSEKIARPGDVIVAGPVERVSLLNSMRPFRFATLALCSAVALSCSGDSNGPSDPRVNVLFIGNSLTYDNDLPLMVEALAAASGESFAVESFTGANMALIDHYNNSRTVDAVRHGDYDFVVLQQGPSTLPINRDSLRISAELWNPAIRQSGAKPALFSVWPESQRVFAFPEVSTSYRLAAEAVNGVFLPVGDTWLEAWDRDPDAPLYGGDGYHPSAAGSFAAAVVIVAVLANRDPHSLAEEYSGMPVSIELGRTIRDAASAVLAEQNVLRNARGAARQ